MQFPAPIVFEPIYMDRVWGGRRLETHFGRRLPSHGRIGEAWEIVDRVEAQSVVHAEPLRGKTLHELWTKYRADVFGAGVPESERFPLLFKLLDARERLSLQVHPPAHCAEALAGECKTEMWYILDTYGSADIFAGLREGVSREDFERALKEGTVEKTVHRIEVTPGDCIFIPSGRIHAIGAGNLIVEVQQNSDTTYRVFDWNRVGLDGKVRQLHVEESMQSIDFDDTEPSLQARDAEPLVECDHFRVEKWNLTEPREGAPAGEFAIFTVLSGTLRCSSLVFHPGDFFLLPASMGDRVMYPMEGSPTVLRTTMPCPSR